ncbi:ABC transporter permease [Virgisporangium ochraceum]
MIRATFRSLLARKLRLALSGVAVILAVTFISGSLVLNDTLGRTFDNLFSNVYQYTDLEVAAKPSLEFQGIPVAQPLPESVVDRVEGVSGVSKAVGYVATNGALVLGKDGKLLPNQSGTQLGANWLGDDPVIRMREGEAPRADDEVALNAQAAKDGDYKVGQTVVVRIKGENREFRIVGIAGYTGGRDSLGGEFMVFWNDAQAQRLMLGETGLWSNIAVEVDDGASVKAVQNDLKATLGDTYTVETGDELAEKSSAPLKEIFNFINYVLLGFAGVALLVGVFLILNTFSIIVAQRTRELALMRAIGAGRGQMIGSVMIEAVVVGLIGSAAGLLLGVGLGWVGAWGLGKLAAGGLELAGLGVPAAAVVSSFVIGTTVTVLAALLPALRAARIPPVAAMRYAADTDRSIVGLTVAGGIVTATGVALLVLGLNGTGDEPILLVLGGILFGLIGVALLTPLLCRPVVSAVGRIFSWSVPGKLGRRNSSRNPRRTAITAAAVMIGIALITGVSTIVSSVSTTIDGAMDKQMRADIIVAGTQTSETPPILDQPAYDKVRALPDVRTAAAVSLENFVEVEGEGGSRVWAYDDWADAREVLQMPTGTGDITSLDRGEIIADQETAKAFDKKAGDRVTLALPQGERTFTLVGVTGRTEVNTGWIVNHDDAVELFKTPQWTMAYLTLDDGASVTAVKDQVDDVLANSPEVSAQTRDEYIGSQTVIFDFLLGAVQVLLLVAIAISVLGIINTLVLSVLERTRELGMLRAIGLRRSQTMRMITVESVVISLFGTILGLGVGLGLGVAVVEALKDDGITSLTLPVGLMVVYLFAAVVIGVAAAVIPAVRAARLNVLNAIAYE